MILCALLLFTSVVLPSEDVECVVHDSQVLEKCMDDDDSPGDLCYTIWSGDGVHLAGCIASLGWGLQSYQACRTPYCVDTAEVEDDRMLFCCCNTTGCNKNYVWKPRQARIEKIEENLEHNTEEHKKTISDNNLVIYILGCVGVLSVITIVFLIACITCGHDKDNPDKKDNKTDEGGLLVVPQSSAQQEDKIHHKLETLLEP